MGFEIVSNMGCNLGCTYCYEKHYNKYIDLEKASNLITTLINNHDRNEKLIIPIAGGEPFLDCRKLDELLSFLVTKLDENNIKDYIFSLINNGTLLHKEQAIALIKKYKNHIRLSISFDGIEQSQNKTRVTKQGKPTFDIVYKNILLMQEILGKDKIGLNLVVSDDNIPFISKSLKFLCSLKPWRIKINFANECISEKYIYELNCQLIDFIDYYFKNNLDITIYHLFDKNINQAIPQPLQRNIVSPMMRKLCVGGDLNMVGIDGKKYLCLRYHNLGIDIDQLNKVMQGTKFAKDLAPKSCQNCILFNSCFDCMAIPFEKGIHTLEQLKEYYKEKPNCLITKTLSLIQTYIHSKLLTRNKNA